MRSSSLLIITFITLSSGNAASFTALDTETIHQKAEKLQLFRDTTWLKLLHLDTLEGDTSKSSIITPEFFLSSNNTQKISPKEELSATIAALFTPPHPKHAQCQFPARFLWLQEKLQLTPADFPPISCPQFAQWSDLENLSSISLLMVSGYFGNPASTFGHVLIKIQHGEQTASGNLLDQGVNFGATIPPKEPPLLYIAKGIFGGYVAGFSDSEFYNQDLVYSQTENRDMWEYQLNLTDHEEKLIVSHLWELKRAKYVYYFLKENCAFRVAELFELTNDDQWVNKRLPWALPAALFHKIDDIDKSRDTGLIKSITFIPSSQRKLYEQFNALEPREQQDVNSIIKRPKRVDTHSHYSANTLSTALAYFQYKIASTKSDPSPAHLQARDLTLKTRLQRPPADKQKNRGHTPPPISKGAKPSLIAAHAGYQENHGAFSQLRFAAIGYEPIGNYKGGLEKSGLRIADLTISIDKNTSPRLEQFDLVSVRKLEIDRTGIAGESSLSWEISTGFKRPYATPYSHARLYARGAMGKTFQPREGFKFFTMLGAEYQSTKDALYALPMAGLIYNPGKRAAASLEIESRIHGQSGEKEYALEFESRFSVTQHKEIRISIQQNKNKTAIISYQYNW